MKQDALQGAEKYTKAHQRKKRWYRIVTVLACVVVFCTTYALILPAITLEKKCEIPEHTHTDACYTQVTTREKRSSICAVKADVVVHRHDSTCYDEDGNLWCTLPEVEAHRHTDACYIQPEAHTHTDACYTLERGNLICTESTEPAHVHSDDCYPDIRLMWIKCLRKMVTQAAHTARSLVSAAFLPASCGSSSPITRSVPPARIRDRNSILSRIMGRAHSQRISPR